jgi:hypothetical protein
MLLIDSDRPSFRQEQQKFVKPAIDSKAMGRVNPTLIDSSFQPPPPKEYSIISSAAPSKKENGGSKPKGTPSNPDNQVFNPSRKPPEQPGLDIPFVRLQNPTFDIFNASSSSPSGSIRFPQNPDILPPKLVGGAHAEAPTPIDRTPLGQKGLLPDMMVGGSRNAAQEYGKTILGKG